jgi:hypothetical protein
MNEAGRGAAPSVRRSGWDAGPRGERLGRVQSAVWSGYGAGEGTWESGSLGQGSKEHVTGWSVTGTMCHGFLRTFPECSLLVRGLTSASNCHFPS